MSLQHALLVSLAEQEATGYDLTRRFDRSVGFFWSATHQQIYRVLSRMTDAGLVAVRVEPGDGKPDRRVYSLTDDGRRELRVWTELPTPSSSLRSEFAVKVRGMNYGNPGAVLNDIRRQRAAHAEQLAYYEANCAKNFVDVEGLSPDERPIYAVLRGGIHTERAMLQWCDEMLATLDPDGVNADLDTQTAHGAKTQRHRSKQENSHELRPLAQPLAGRQCHPAQSRHDGVNAHGL